MPSVDKTMLLAILAGAAIAAVHASCANSCSGHGTCGSHDRCTCYAMWEGTDCSLKTCPSGASFTDGGATYAVCSGRGVCDSATGACACSEGYTGYNCGRTACPNDCSGHGKCSTIGGSEWDSEMTRQCVCDGYYTGADCSFRQCPRGDDPLTTEIECQGVASGVQSHEVQEITISADKMLSGEMTLTYTDAYGQPWTTMPIAVGGDLTYDLRLSGAATGCSLSYQDARLIPHQQRTTTATSATLTDFATTQFTVPGSLASAMTATDCDEMTAAQMQALLEQNSAVKNVKVTKSEDVATGAAKFEVSFGDLNFQGESDGMEVGIFGLEGRTDETFHPLGDRSQAIKDALTSLPYNVIPSVSVNTVKVDGGSDHADSTVVYGNMIKQKYRVTFSDAANAGDQNMLQCNAEGCNADGCAPRYAGVQHQRYISTKRNYAPMDTTGGVTDYRTAIVATGQGSFWIRTHTLNARDTVTFTSGTYYLHWTLDNGEVSSASFPYDASEAVIQTALQTIQGWGGVSVSCDGTAANSGFTGASRGLACKVTYAVGFDDGGRVPTMTYHNLHQSMDASASTERSLLDTTAANFVCRNGICTIGAIPSPVAAHIFTKPIDDGTAIAGTTSLGKNDNSVGYVYIRSPTNTALFPKEGTYEIIRSSGGGLMSSATADLIIACPGCPDMANYAAAFGVEAAYVYKSTPLMVMWPSFSNSIALHDTSFRVILDSGRTANGGTAEALGTTRDPSGSDGAGLNQFQTGALFNLVYGSSGIAATDWFSPATTCTDIHDKLKGMGGSGPFPSLAHPTDTTLSICDCERHDMEFAPFEIEITITCPGWLGYMIHPEDSLHSGVANVAKTTTAEVFHVFHHHRSLTPARSLEQIVAVGDSLTITSSNSNTNKVFTVSSFVHDTNFGDGRGSAIWSSANAGFLGGDHASGFVAGGGVALDSSIDYKSYGDYVPFAKVSPAPADDYMILEMVAEGTNGTHFSRVLEDVSTYTQEVATLRLYDHPTTDATKTTVEGSTTAGVAGGYVKSEASQLSGTFQLIYDGVESPIIPVTASANMVMEYLSQMSSMTHVPTVVKSDSVTGTLAGTVEAVTALSAWVQWEFTFDGRNMDAKKLTFKYADAEDDEQQTSNIIGSDSSTRLKNQMVTLAAARVATLTSHWARNEIVMSYVSGSAFYDALDADYNGGAADATISGTGVRYHDELAQDVVPGTTINVSSAEDFFFYLYDNAGPGASDETDSGISTLDSGCAGATSDAYLIFEYEGQFSAPVSMCSAAATLQTEANLKTGIDSLSGLDALGGCTVAATAHAVTNNPGSAYDTSNTAVDAAFKSHFPWAANHNGKAYLQLKFTLPLGARGDTFKIHYQSPDAGDGAGQWAANADYSEDIRAFTHRARNNNGRTFTVTKAYENKVSDLISIQVAESVSFNGGALYGTWLGTDLTCGAVTMTPGTYYGVKVVATAEANMNAADNALGTTYLGRGAELMVVVNGAGSIAYVEATQGGTQYLPGEIYVFADTRISSTMAVGAAATQCELPIGAQTSPATTNMLTKTYMGGASSSMNCASVGGTAASMCSDSGGTYWGVPGLDTTIGSPERTIFEVTCSGTAINGFTVLSGGVTAIDGSTTAEKAAGSAAGIFAPIAVDPNTAIPTISSDCTNDYYIQFGMYDTTTPRFVKDTIHDTYDRGAIPKHAQVTVMGGKSRVHYSHNGGTTASLGHRFYGSRRDTFTDLLPGQYAQGYAVPDEDTRAAPTASVIAGENGADATEAAGLFLEKAERYAYVGRGYDKLTVTPMPDPMTAQKVVVTYTGPSASCTVTEVDRGTHESSECSGRGNCDYTTGTCLCDAGYTLEACSEQTVLV